MMIAVLDIETLPIRYSTQPIPPPFAVCLYNGTNYKVYWGDNCIEQSLSAIKRFNGKIYAHNGGKFDFLYYTDQAHSLHIGPLQRIHSMRLGKATLIDSWPLLRAPLSALNKLEINLQKFLPQHRDAHKTEIITYLKNDCKILFDYLTQWETKYGKIHKSIGTAARELCQEKNLWLKKRLTLAQDRRFRPWFFSGRVENFYLHRSKPLHNVHYYDINSAYPFAMLSEHPIAPDRVRVHTSQFNEIYQYHKRFYLIRLRAGSYGQYPFRHKTNDHIEVTYPRDGQIREFQITSWEFQAALAHFGDTTNDILEAWEFPVTVSFRDYIEPLYAAKISAKTKNERLSAKLLLNSLFGKFGQNPASWKNYNCVGRGLIGKGKYLYTLGSDTHDIYGKNLLPSQIEIFTNNVVTAASISGLVRARMLKLISTETITSKILYVDTDCILSTSPLNLPLSLRLGDFKHKIYDEVWIESKRRYCARHEDKWLSKSAGENLTYQEIIRLCTNRSIFPQVIPERIKKY